MPNYPFEKVKADYTRRWAAMEIHPHRREAIEKIADKIISHKQEYENLQDKTGVPWYFIGLLHFRESSCRFDRHLHNGDPLTARTYRVPAGRPLRGNPPFTFEESAIDALTMMGYTKNKNWSIERIAYYCEKFNGFGYRYNGVPSAYLWSGTNQYVKGKYIRDHVFDPNVVDVQQGCMAVFKIILDKTNEEIPKDDELIEEAAIAAPKAVIEPPSTTQMNTISRKHYWNDWLKWLGIGGTATTTGIKAAQTLDLEVTKNSIENIKQIAEVIGMFGLMILFLGIIIYAVYQSKLMKDDIVEGRATPSGEKET